MSTGEKNKNKIDVFIFKYFKFYSYYNDMVIKMFIYFEKKSVLFQIPGSYNLKHNYYIFNNKNLSNYVKLLIENNITYNYDLSKFNINKIYYNFFAVNTTQHYLNYIFFYKTQCKEYYYTSSVFSYRELFDMYGVEHSNIYDNRRLLLDYSQKRGVLINWT